MKFWNEKLQEKFREAVVAVGPVVGIMLILSFTAAPMSPGTLLSFLLGAVLVIVRRAAEQAAREGRQEEFADMLQAASDRFAMLMHRSGPGRRDFGQPDWLTALQDVVRGAYDDDPARMESLVRWAADRAAEEGQMGRVRGLIEEAARRVRAVSRRNGSFWDAF